LSANDVLALALFNMARSCMALSPADHIHGSDPAMWAERAAKVQAALYAAGFEITFCELATSP
jgi:hypothetical protein